MGASTRDDSAVANSGDATAGTGPSVVIVVGRSPTAKNNALKTVRREMTPMTKIAISHQVNCSLTECQDNLRPAPREVWCSFPPRADGIRCTRAAAICLNPLHLVQAQAELHLHPRLMQEMGPNFARAQRGRTACYHQSSRATQASPTSS